MVFEVYINENHQSRLLDGDYHSIKVARDLENKPRKEILIITTKCTTIVINERGRKPMQTLERDEEFTLAYCDHPSQRPVSHSISSDKSHLLSSYPPHSGFACDETLTLFALSEEPFILFPL